MTRLSTENELAGSYQVVLVLRLVLDRQAWLRHGELLDARAIVQGRFVTVVEMGELVQRWLDQQRADVERAP